MPTLKTSDGVELHWSSWGDGDPVLLIHGFASTVRRNWEGTGWVRALERAGHRVIAYDQRGHGRSEKLHDPEDYPPERLADDAIEVLDAAKAPRASLVGYSMGGMVALAVGVRHPGRVRALALGGVGMSFFPDLGGPVLDPEPVAHALEAEDATSLASPLLVYRRFAEENGQDLRAMAACWRRERRPPSRSTLGALRVPTLLVVGDRDDTAGNPSPVAEAIPGARLVVLPGKDHTSAVGAREHRESLIAFLRGPS